MTLCLCSEQTFINYHVPMNEEKFNLLMTISMLYTFSKISNASAVFNVLIKVNTRLKSKTKKRTSNQSHNCRPIKSNKLQVKN